MFEKIKRLLSKPIAPEAPETPDTGAISGITPHLPMLGLSGFGLRNGSYDNTYPSISRIADAIAEVQPIAIGADGKEKKNAHLLEVLNRPNKEMCSTDFMEALAVMLLVHPKIHLLVWRRDANGELVAGGNITEQNIAGLTFMEGVSERIVGGKSEYGINGKIFTEDEVLTLSLAVNPYHLADGYSPSVAAKKWASTDDYIAEYHNAQFRNNARPAGMLTIVADSVDEFNDAVDTIEAKFRGASNAGNTIYNMRPSQTLDGKPAPAKIEWTPFAQTNKDLTLEPVYNQANRKLESVFGVPEEVRGHLQNSNYASAEVADYIFSRRVVYPTLVKIYSKLTHELNRVTGGLGYALSFHYEVPMLTDTRKLQAEALKTMMDAGFTVETSVEALRLPESYKVLQLAPPVEAKKELAPAKVVRATRPTTSKAEDIEQTRIASGKTACGLDRMAQADKARSAEPLPKEDLVSPNLLIAYDDLTRTVLAGIEDSITGMVATYEEDGALDIEYELDLLDGKLEQAYHTNPDLDKNITTIKTDLDHLRIGTIAKQAQELSAELGVEVETGSIGLEIKKRIAEVVTDDLYDSYRTTVKNLLNHTAEIIYRVIADDNQTADELENQIIDELEQLDEKQHWRAVRFGFTEQQIVMSITAEMLWVWAQNKYQFKGYKTWHISPLSPAPCEDCIKTDGETVRVGEKFSNGAMYPPLHPNCYCYCEYSTGRAEEDKGTGCGASDDATDEAPRDARRVRARRSTSDTNIKITCPKCGRFLMDASEAKIQKMICPNTKCKARLAIDTIKDGATIVNEIENE